MNFWGWMRLGLWMLFFLGPLAEMEPLGTSWSLLWGVPLTFLAGVGIPFLSCGLKRFEEMLVSRESLWQHPSLSISPFVKHKPLQFIWTAGVACVVAAFSAAIGSLIHSAEHLQLALCWAAAGGGILLGIRLCLKAFHIRFAD